MRQENWVLSDTPGKLYTEGAETPLSTDPGKAYGHRRESEFDVAEATPILASSTLKKHEK